MSRLFLTPVKVFFVKVWDREGEPPCQPLEVVSNVSRLFTTKVDQIIKMDFVIGSLVRDIRKCRVKLTILQTISFGWSLKKN